MDKRNQNMEKRQTYNIYTTCYGGNAGANARNNLCKQFYIE